MQNVRIFLNLEDRGILKKYEEVEVSLQIAMGIAAFFLQQGIKVSCYANGKDIFTDEHIALEGGASASLLDTMGKALARIDTEKGTHSFCDLFQKKILEEADESFMFFISPNGYPDFAELLEICEQKGMDFCWYYPVVDEAVFEKSPVCRELEVKGKLVQLPCRL